MQLTVDGEFKMDINNDLNTEEVYWDGVLWPQSSKYWQVIVKPLSEAKDYKLVIK
jgi:hypothetical protein